MSFLETRAKELLLPIYTECDRYRIKKKKKELKLSQQTDVKQEIEKPTLLSCLCQLQAYLAVP